MTASQIYRVTLSARSAYQDAPPYSLIWGVQARSEQEALQAAEQHPDLRDWYQRQQHIAEGHGLIAYPYRAVTAEVARCPLGLIYSA